MKNLWFKARYVESIQREEKIDTIRRPSIRYQLGEIVGASVGPRPPFARLRILSIESIRLSDLDPVRRREVVDCFPSCENELIRLRFQLVERVSDL